MCTRPNTYYAFASLGEAGRLSGPVTSNFCISTRSMCVRIRFVLALAYILGVALPAKGTQSYQKITFSDFSHFSPNVQF